MAAPLVVGDVFRSAARAVPRRTAAVLGARALTFGELDAAADSVATVLGHMGVARGRRVGGWSATTLDVVPVFAALAKLGAAFAPLSPLWGAAEAGPALRHLAPAVLVADEAHEAEARALGADVGARVLTLPELLREASTEGGGDPGTAVLESDPHVVFSTSGSSGAPKGVVVSHRAGVLRSVAGALPEPRGSMVCSYPLFHMGAWTIALQQWQARDTVVFVERADAAQIVDAVDRHQATRLNCVPAVWRRILDEAGMNGGDRGPLATLRFADTGTSATPVEFLTALAAALPRARVRVFYGSTEAGCVSVLEHDDIERKPGSCGVPGPFTAVRVGEDGRLLVRGPLLFDGYLDDPAATAAAIGAGWYDTGDLAEQDEEGYLSIVGRAREVIRTGGETVSPVEVEEALAGCRGIAEVAVVGLPDADWGEVVCAVVVVPEGDAAPGVEEVRARCAGRLAPFKHPRRVVVVDRLPRTAATGQVQRRLLVEHLS